MPPDDGLSLAQMHLSRLEAHYWACDALIARSMPTPDEFEHCSLVYETLKLRRFGGSTERFALWLRLQPKPPASACKRTTPSARV